MKKKDEPKTTAELDAEMDEYFLKSGNKEIAAKKLDDAMDDYWAKRGNDEEEVGDGEEKVAAEVGGD
jgi:hypothetical protein